MPPAEEAAPAGRHTDRGAPQPQLGYFDDPVQNRKLKAAATLAGPERYRVYGALDADLARNSAPLVAIANLAARDFFSARIGCQLHQPVYGIDLAALCLRRANG